MPSSTKRKPRTEADRRRRIAEIAADPVLFSRHFLRHDPWSKSEEILRSIARPHSSTAVKACHSSSKTFTAAEAVLWFLTRYRAGKVVTTAPKFSQVKELLWRELRLAMQSSRIAFPEPKLTEWVIDPGRYAVGRASGGTGAGVGIQGFHTGADGHVLIIIDEAPGVDDPEVWAAIEGIRAGGDVRVLALGNPTISSGPFFDLWNEQREGWNLITISAFDCPNFTGLTLEDVLALPDDELDRNVRPYLITRRFVRDKWSEWGDGHPDWDGRILGQFPAQSSNSLISLSWLEAAASRDLVDDGGPATVGLDVAGPGEDETVGYARRNGRVLRHAEWPDADPRGPVTAWLKELEVDGDRGIEAINVDSAGIGWGMYLHLADIWGEKVHAVNVGESPNDGEKYANLKAELYWGLRMRFKDGDIGGLDDRKARAQLGSILWKQNPRGQTVIESKDEARKRGVKSPDRAEAIMLAFGHAEPSWQTWMREDAAARRAQG